MSIPTRKIGDTQVTAIGFGAMGMSVGYGEVGSLEERLKLLDAVYQSGCTNWDTADVYGDSEDVIGEWFKRTGKRNDIFLATKFGLVLGTDPTNPARVVNGTPEHAKKSIENSLKRLGVDTIDLYYLHRPDPDVPIETTVSTMAEFVKAGKIKYIGLSEISAATLRRAHAVHPIVAIQVEYSPFTLDIESDKIGLVKTARELGVAIIAYSPLGRGLLTGQYKSPDDFPEGDFRRTVPRYSKENFPNILKLVNALKKVAEHHNATPGQVSLAWLLAQGEDVIPIPGTKNIKYLKENLDSLKVKLSPEEVEEVRKMAIDSDSAQGDRYPGVMMAVLYGDTPELK